MAGRVEHLDRQRSNVEYFVVVEQAVEFDGTRRERHMFEDRLECRLHAGDALANRISAAALASSSVACLR